MNASKRQQEKGRKKERKKSEYQITLETFQKILVQVRCSVWVGATYLRISSSLVDPPTPRASLLAIAQRKEPCVYSQHTLPEWSLHGAQWQAQVMVAVIDVSDWFIVFLLVRRSLRSLAAVEIKGTIIEKNAPDLVVFSQHAFTIFAFLLKTNT